MIAAQPPGVTAPDGAAARSFAWGPTQTGPGWGPTQTGPGWGGTQVGPGPGSGADASRVGQARS